MARCQLVRLIHILIPLLPDKQDIHCHALIALLLDTWDFHCHALMLCRAKS